MIAEPTMTPLPREARLRPEFAPLYPGIPVDTWLPAADLGATLLMHHLRAPAPPELGNRLLDESHFEFRGGASRGTGRGGADAAGGERQRTELRLRAESLGPGNSSRYGS